MCTKLKILPMHLFVHMHHTDTCTPQTHADTHTHTHTHTTHTHTHTRTHTHTHTHTHTGITRQANHQPKEVKEAHSLKNSLLHNNTSSTLENQSLSLFHSLRLNGMERLFQVSAVQDQRWYLCICSQCRLVSLGLVLF